MRSLSCLLLVLSSHCMAASDWPAFRGSDGSGTSDSPVPITWGETENVKWKQELPGAGTSTPVVIGSRIFLTCYSGYNVPGESRGTQQQLKLHLVCLDRASGAIQWVQDVDPKLPEQEDIRDGHGYASSTPVADGERVYAFFGKTGVFALDHDGNQFWHVDVGSELSGWGSGASLVLADGLLLVNASVESGRLYALDAKTGEEVWHTDGIKESWNTPLVVEHDASKQVVVGIFGKLMGLDLKTGQQIWNSDTDIPWYMVPSIVEHDGVVYAIGGRPGGGLAVRLGGEGDVTATHRLWTSDKGGNVSSPIYHDGHLYWMHDNLSIAFCADAKTGELVYQERVRGAGQVYGSAILAGGNIYYPSRGGKMFVVAAKPEFELVATNSLGERGEHNASPSVAGDQLFIRSNKFLYCIAD